jgi:hypothetical protein
MRVLTCLGGEVLDGLVQGVHPAAAGWQLEGGDSNLGIRPLSGTQLHDDCLING